MSGEITPEDFYEKNKKNIKLKDKEVMPEILTVKELWILKFSKDDQEERLVFKSFLQPPMFPEEE